MTYCPSREVVLLFELKGENGCLFKVPSQGFMKAFQMHSKFSRNLGSRASKNGSRPRVPGFGAVLRQPWF